MVYLYKFGYERKKDKTSSGIPSILIDRSWRYLTEISNYYLVPELKNNGENYSKDFRGYAHYILKIFQNLIKISYDKKDYVYYEIFIDKMYNIAFDSLSYSHHRENNYVNTLKQELLFEMGAWVLSRITGFNSTEDKRYLLCINNYLTEDIEKLSEFFLELYSIKNNQKWNIHEWEFGDHGENEVFFSNVANMLKEYYIYIVLVNINKYSMQSIAEIELPLEYEYVSLIENDNNLVNSLDSIVEDENLREELLPQSDLNKLRAFKELLLNTKEKFDEKEKNIIRDAEISQFKVDEFKENFELNVNSVLGFKDLYKQNNKWELEKIENDESDNRKLGINQILNKTPFLKDDVFPHIINGGFDNAFDYGKTMSRGETSLIINILKDKIPQVKISELDQYIEESDVKENLVIVSINNAAFYQFEHKQTDNYISNWEESFSEINIDHKDKLSGIYKFSNTNIPVYNFYSQDEEMFLILLDKNYMGNINQYISNEVSDDEQVNEFYFSIKEYKRDSMEALETIDDAPNWLVERGDKIEQALYLQEKVNIQISEIIEFEADKEIRGAIISVKRE